MITDLLILLITGVTTTILGCVVYLRNPKSAMSRFFLFVCISVITWAITNFAIDYAPTLALSTFAAHISAAAGFNMLFWLYIFACQFGTLKNQPNKQGVFLTLSVWVIGSGFSASSLVIAAILPGSDVMNIQSGVAYLIYLGVLLVLLCGTLMRLIQAKGHVSALESRQITFILWGVALSSSCAIVTNVVAPLFIENWQVAKSGPILSLFCIGFISYAIIKHRLFDIRFIIARTVSYTLLLAIMGSLYTTVVFFLTGLLFHGTFNSGQVGAYTVIALFIAFTFEPLKHYLERLTDRIFYKNHYIVADLLAELTKIMASTFRLESLTSRTLKELLNAMRVMQGSFYVMDEKNHLQLMAQLEEHSGKTAQIPSDHLLEFPDLAIYEEVSDEAKKTLMRKYNLAIIMPLRANGMLQGVVALGPKQSGDIYEDRDIQVLQILGAELGVALDNARSYKQISEFNLTLKQEVNKATSQLRQANEELHQKNLQLENLDKLKDEFISVTSHELRTPLTAIRGYLWMAMHGRRRDQNYRLYMDRAYQSSERLIDLVNDTLDVSRMESGRVELEPAPTDLPALAQEVANELASRAAERQQDLTISTANLPQAYCDSNKIRQVITNLIGNALKFTPKQGHINVSFAQDGQQIITRVYDSGPSLTPEEQAKLFQKFSRLGTTLSSTPGTGLGLYLCKQIVELSGGHIWVESTQNQGTSFLFSLPISHQAASSPTSPAPIVNHAMKSSSLASTDQVSPSLAN